MKFKSKLISAILASSLILSITGCSKNADKANSENPSSSSVENSTENTNTTTIFDDIETLKTWKPGVMSLDLSMTANNANITANLDFKTTEDASINYIDINNLNVNIPGESTDSIATSDTNVNFKDIDIYVANNKLYADIDIVYSILSLSGSDVNPEEFKTQFESKYGDVKYLTMDLDSSSDVTGDVTVNIMNGMPEDVTIDEFKNWVENNAVPTFTKSFESVKNNFITTGETHKLFLNNQNTNDLINCFNTMIDDGSFKNLIESLRSLSESAEAISDEEYAEKLSELKDQLAKFSESLKNDNKFNFEIETSVKDNTADISIKSDISVTSEMPKDGAEDVQISKPTNIKFDIKLTVENTKAELTLPAESDAISYDSVFGSSSSGYENSDSNDYENYSNDDSYITSGNDYDNIEYNGLNDFNN